jgi:hypothetical protein
MVGISIATRTGGVKSREEKVSLHGDSLRISNPYLQNLAITIFEFDYPTAIFWGFELVLLYNQAWADAGGILEQGRPQRGSLSPDAWHALQKCINGGKPSSIASHLLLRECSKPARDDYTVLLSPLFGKISNSANGALCQMIAAILT